jgi:hypothetical protein
MTRMLHAAWLKRLASAAMALALVCTAPGAGPKPVHADSLGIPVVVGFFSPPPANVCLNHKYKLEYYVTVNANFIKPGMVPLAPLVPIKPVNVTFQAQHGTPFPKEDLVGPFKAFGQTITRWLTYTAKTEGQEKLTIQGATEDGDWKADMEFEVKKCKEKVRGTADMSPVTNKMNKSASQLWQAVSSLDMQGEAEVGEDSVKGTGTANFFMDMQWQGVEGNVIVCTMTPPWSGSGDIAIAGDPAALQDSELALKLDIDSMPINATTFACSGVGNVFGSFPLPGWSVAALNIQMDPLPIEGGVTTKDFSFGQYQIPLLISVVERAAS